MKKETDRRREPVTTERENEATSEDEMLARDAEALRAQLEEERGKAQSYMQSWQRAAADYQNFKRRVEEERSETARFANASLIINLLPLVDDLERALQNVDVLAQQLREIAAPHTHELVRLKETEAMLLAAQFMLRTSLFRTESRLSHFREDHAYRDDANWLVWIDICPGGARPELTKTPIPTPLCPVLARPARPMRLGQRLAVAGG